MRVEGKGEGIQVRGDIAGAAWIGVIAPCPPHVCRLLDQYKVVIPTLLQPDRYAQSGESRPQDSDPNMMNLRFVVRRLVWKDRGLVIVSKHIAAALTCKNTEHACFLH